MITEAAATLTLTTAAYLWTTPAPLHRLRRQRTESKTDNRQREVILRRAAVITVGLVCVTVLGGLLGAVTGTIAGALLHRAFNRMDHTEERARHARLIADLPIAVDLLAACLRGGTPWNTAVDAVAEAMEGPLGAELQAVGIKIRLGVDPAEAWLALTAEPPLASLARTAARAANSGAAPAAALARLVRDQRRTAHLAAEARARTAGVRALLPLGLCFLPAFVLIGIVPAAAGLATQLTLP